MTTFVLVHGGWHGGWCWDGVARILRGEGHEVFAPTLTGLGDLTHMLDPKIDLETHVEDVLGVLGGPDLRGVVLVGHSYGGMVVAGAADRAADRVAHLVFLDAFVPGDGESLFDLLPPERREFYLRGARERGGGWRVPPPPPQALGVTDEEEARLLAARLTPQPIRTFEQPARLTGPAAGHPPRTYVHCTAGPLAPTFAPFAARYQDEPDWGYFGLHTGHDAMLTEPGALSEALLRHGRPGGDRP